MGVPGWVLKIVVGFLSEEINPEILRGVFPEKSLTRGISPGDQIGIISIFNPTQCSWIQALNEKYW